MPRVPLVEYPALNLLRILTLGGITGLSTVAICLVAADRVTHSSFPAPPAMTIAQGAVKGAAPEPETTGTVTQGAEAPEPKAARMLDGFDTERLNALMRGETPPAPAKPASRKR